MTTRVPAFFADVPPIVVWDPLAELLGASEQGHIEYRYADAVQLAGHSCPTVASAWLMTAKALARLYPEDLPERGNIKVELHGAQDEGTEGVCAMVAGLITGAAGAGGFKGIAGRHARRDLLGFDVPMNGRMRFTRLDTLRAVEVDYRPQCVPMPSDMKALLVRATMPEATAEARRAFGDHWQAWVRTILVDHHDDPALVDVVADTTTVMAA